MSARETSDPRAAFADLYRATRADLLRYLIRRCPDAEDAADLLAETYLTAWRKLEAIPAGEAAQLWLYGVARNLLLRSARRRRVAFALIERLAGELQAAQPTPTADQSRHDALRLALAELSEQDREILTLNAWEGLAPREIAGPRRQREHRPHPPAPRPITREKTTRIPRRNHPVSNSSGKPHSNPPRQQREAQGIGLLPPGTTGSPAMGSSEAAGFRSAPTVGRSSSRVVMAGAATERK